MEWNGLAVVQIEQSQDKISLETSSAPSETRFDRRALQPPPGLRHWRTTCQKKPQLLVLELEWIWSQIEVTLPLSV